MKKIYYKPEMLVEIIELQQMIALSKNDSVSADPSKEVLSREDFDLDAESRRKDIWEDEEEEEEKY